MIDVIEFSIDIDVISWHDMCSNVMIDAIEFSVDMYVVKHDMCWNFVIDKYWVLMSKCLCWWENIDFWV